MKLSVLTLLSFLLVTNLSAQVDMVWDDYGLGFSLPRGMKITENDGDFFRLEPLEKILEVVKKETLTKREKEPEGTLQVPFPRLCIMVSLG